MCQTPARLSGTSTFLLIILKYTLKDYMSEVYCYITSAIVEVFCIFVAAWNAVVNRSE